MSLLGKPYGTECTLEDGGLYASNSLVCSLLRSSSTGPSVSGSSNSDLDALCVCVCVCACVCVRVCTCACVFMEIRDLVNVMFEEFR